MKLFYLEFEKEKAAMEELNRFNAGLAKLNIARSKIQQRKMQTELFKSNVNRMKAERDSEQERQAALFTACRTQTPESDLLHMMGSPNDVTMKDDSGWMLLHFAAQLGYNDIVALLLTKGADVNAADNDGRTPLHIATYGGQNYTVEELLDNGADINSKAANGNTPLHEAVFGDKIDTVRQLLAAGANVHVKNNSGETPYALAIAWNKPAIAAILPPEKAGGRRKTTRRSTMRRRQRRRSNKNRSRRR
jgi:hypothetical protein